MPKMAATDRVDDGGTGGRLGTSGSSLPVVQPGPQYRKVVHPCGSQRGSQPEPRRALLVVFKSVPGFRPVIVSICLFGLGDGPHSKIIPHISRALAAAVSYRPWTGWWQSLVLTHYGPRCCVGHIQQGSGPGAATTDLSSAPMTTVTSAITDQAPTR